MDEIGKKLSFYEALAIEDLSIEIPILQRDYAQGRVTAREVLEHFLNTIKQNLEDEGELSLDFIYGTIENERFIPLDGQQRLTTLFLLHWYLATISNRREHLREYLLRDSEGGGIPKFTYETRFSSRDFCKMLLTKDVELNHGVEPSEIIKDQAWFYLNWKQDPTVDAMLNSLDTIHSIFGDSGELYDLLVNKEVKYIYFEFIELNNFGLTDQLYVKMNSRGKPLTPFENFKANLEQVLQDYDKENGTGHKDWFAKKIDKEWTDLFWIYRDGSNLIDDRIMNFLRSVFVNALALQEGVDIQSIRKLINSGESFNFFLLEELNCSNFETILGSLRRFDLLTDNGKELSLQLGNPLIIDEEKLFKSIITDDISYTQRIQAYALFQFVIDNGKEGLHDWLRIVRNLTEGSRIEDFEDYETAIKTISNLKAHSTNIVEYMAGLGEEKLTGLADYQTKEEILKAQLILRGNGWRERIEAIENHPYFKGQVDFLLNFSGISDFAQESGIDSWSEEEEKSSIKDFDAYAEKAKSLFKEDGIIDFNDYLFERALLSFGDYTLRRSRNWSFLINGTDRDISWKRLLRHSNRSVLMNLMDELGEGSVQEQLEEIVENSTVDDWRKYIILYPEIIGVCGKNKFTRWFEDDGSSILLLEKSQTNGLHREYYSYALLCHLRRAGNDVQYHADSSVDYLKYIKRINGKDLTLSFGWYEERYQFRLEVEEEVTDFLSQEDVLQGLLSLGIIK